MDYLQLLVDLHLDGKRQGPGSTIATKLAVELAMLNKNKSIKIADIGCGTGASTLDLAQLLNAEITAVDLFDDFLKVLMKNAEKLGIADKITPLACSMDKLPFKSDEFDMIWSEGAAYNIGFENAITQWRNYLKPKGILAVSEITWLTNKRPSEIQDYWVNAYPEIDTATEKMKILESKGFSTIGYFVLPEYCWIDNYYQPLEKRLDSFLKRHPNNEEVKAIIESEKEEIALYKANKSYYSYGFYIAKKCD